MGFFDRFKQREDTPEEYEDRVQKAQQQQHAQQVREAELRAVQHKRREYEAENEYRAKMRQEKQALRTAKYAPYKPVMAAVSRVANKIGTGLTQTAAPRVYGKVPKRVIYRKAPKKPARKKEFIGIKPIKFF